MTTNGEAIESGAGAALSARVRVGALGGEHTALPGGRSATAAAPEDVSVEALLAIMPSCPRPRAERHAPPLNRAMAEFRIENRLRRAAFLAQIAYETAELAWFEEIGSGMERDARVSPARAREIGNRQPGDGARFKARGPIPLVGRAAYKSAGRALGLDLEGHPGLAAQPAIAFRVAGHLFQSRGLDALADEGKLQEITRIVGGRGSHHDARLAYYDKALAALKD
jgi:putative chitinase